MSCPACGGEAIGASTDPFSGTMFRCHGCNHTWSAPAKEERKEACATAKELAPVAETARKRKRRQADALPGSAPLDPIRAMRVRKKWLEAELRQLSKLQAELDELNRILSAATSKPGAVLRGAVKLAAAR